MRQANAIYHPTGPARQCRRSVRRRRAYCEGAPAVGFGHIESNDGAFCDAGWDAGAGAGARAGAAAGWTGAVGGGAGQMPCDCCAACDGGGAVGGGAGHATSCDAAPVGGGAGQFAGAGCCGGVPLAPTSIRVGFDFGGFGTPCGRPIATLGFGFDSGFASGLDSGAGPCCAIWPGGGFIASGSASAASAGGL